MARKVKNLIKRIGNSYIEGFNRLYGPCINAGVNPFV